MGRKLTLTAEVQAKMVEIISTTGQDKDAFQLCGVPEPTFYRWLKLGGEQTEGVYREFREAIEKARGARRVALVARIQQAARAGTWQAAAWLLERTESETYALKNKTEVSGPNGGAVRLVIDMGGGK